MSRPSLLLGVAAADDDVLDSRPNAEDTSLLMLEVTLLTETDALRVWCEEEPPAVVAALPPAPETVGDPVVGPEPRMCAAGVE